MKKKLFIFPFFLLIFPLSLSGQEVVNYPVAIAIVGTSNYNDVDFVLKNLRRSSQISQLSIVLESKGLVELKGTYRGLSEGLIEEIRGLAQDRFAMEIQKPKGRQPSGFLSVTLRKLSQRTPPS